MNQKIRRIERVTFKGVDVTDIVCYEVKYTIPHELHMSSCIWYGGIEYDIIERLGITEEELKSTPFILHLENGEEVRKKTLEIHNPSLQGWMGIDKNNKLVGIGYPVPF